MIPSKSLNKAFPWRMWHSKGVPLDSPDVEVSKGVSQSSRRSFHRNGWMPPPHK